MKWTLNRHNAYIHIGQNDDTFRIARTEDKMWELRRNGSLVGVGKTLQICKKSAEKLLNKGK